MSALFLDPFPTQPCLLLNLNLVFSPVDGSGEDAYILLGTNGGQYERDFAFLSANVFGSFFNSGR